MNPIRQVLVHVDDEALAREALHLGAAIAQSFGAQVTALLALPRLATGAYLSAETAALAQQLAQVHLATQRAAAEALVASIAAPLGCAIDLRMADAEPVEALQTHGRTADLLIVSQQAPAGGGGLSAGQAARLLVGAGTPVLVVPHIGWGRSEARPMAGAVLQRALVAWSDKRESARALRDALPLLARARQVDLVSFASEAGATASVRVTLDAAAAYLARHGVAAQVSVLQGREPSLTERLRNGWIPDVSVAEALLSHAADVQADFIVMGGYGHARLWEFVLGGVTRTMLASMTVPVLMSH